MILLLGDSIFDNAAYVGDVDDCVLSHVRRECRCRVQLAAVDGHRVQDVSGQLQRVLDAASISHVVISVGGNDALQASSQLAATKSRKCLMTALGDMAGIITKFSDGYAAMLREVREKFPGIPLYLCTIYNQVPALSPAQSAGLRLFNDVITEAASLFGASLIDLRVVCRDAACYSAASPIEPSAVGGSRIAKAIAEVTSWIDR